MDAEDEPPSKQVLLERKREACNLEAILSIPDKKGILLEPNEKDGELAVFNCSIPQIQGWPKPFLYRKELPKRNRFGRYSVIGLRWLKSPTEFADEKKRTIIFPTEEYEKYGCEDPRVTFMEDTYYITYVAYDGVDSRVALATTKDFKKIKKFGIISPQIRLEEAIEVVGDEVYSEIWQEELEKNKYRKGKKVPTDKDAFIIKKERYKFYHRLGNYMQIAEVDNLEQLKDQNFWKEYLKNIEQHTRMKNTDPWISDKWASKKIGWGSVFFEVGDKIVEAWHGVDETNGNLVYSCSFLEEKDGKIVSILRNPLFVPSEEDLSYYDDNGRMRIKKVIFVTTAIADKEADQIYFYYGSGDKKIGYYATNKHWLYRELNNPYNRLQLV